MTIIENRPGAALAGGGSHTHLYCAYQTAPGRTAGTVASADVDLASPGVTI